MLGAKRRLILCLELGGQIAIVMISRSHFRNPPYIKSHQFNYLV